MKDKYILNRFFPPMPVPSTDPGYIPNYNKEIYKMLKNTSKTYIYIWVSNENNNSSGKEGFWFFLTGIDDGNISGYKWNGNYWQHVTLNLNQIINYY